MVKTFVKLIYLANAHFIYSFLSPNYTENYDQFSQVFLIMSLELFNSSETIKFQLNMDTISSSLKSKNLNGMVFQFFILIKTKEIVIIIWIPIINDWRSLYYRGLCLHMTLFYVLVLWKYLYYEDDFFMSFYHQLFS